MSAPHEETYEMHNEVATVARAMLSAGLAVADARRQQQLRAAREAEQALPGRPRTEPAADAGLRRYTGPAGASAQAEYERVRDLHRLGARHRLRRQLLWPAVRGVLVALVYVVVIFAVLSASSVTEVVAVLLVGVLLAAEPAARRAHAVYRVPEEVDRWRRGADGERATALRLQGVEALGWPVLHDRQLPGTSANIDQLIVGPGGVFAIDSKHWSGTLAWDGTQLWRGRTGWAVPPAPPRGRPPKSPTPCPHCCPRGGPCRWSP